ncbi:hypothetical protein BDU57DRAFT_569329 [Ampelomyces quisqualis]|uniref:Uncharacterized protein n=1 Tax=Ampelomyces quisqualis TaxID=50730 RepID=A0A6A5QXD0_AMPQU|nr:hypothetical protein BDU57DRAFT_569329 [Ampelomyces quisqualis]
MVRVSVMNEALEHHLPIFHRQYTSFFPPPFIYSFSPQPAISVSEIYLPFFHPPFHPTPLPLPPHHLTTPSASTPDSSSSFSSSSSPSSSPPPSPSPHPPHPTPQPPTPRSPALHTQTPARSASTRTPQRRARIPCHGSYRGGVGRRREGGVGYKMRILRRWCGERGRAWRWGRVVCWMCCWRWSRWMRGRRVVLLG